MRDLFNVSDSPARSRRTADCHARAARSRLAPLAAFPVRFASVARYDIRVLGQSASWLLHSREHTNYTYDLTPSNREHLAWWISTVTHRPVAEIREFMAELHADCGLRDHIRRATAASKRRGLADQRARYGRRVGWYAITRALRPSVVIETGTDKGLGSCVFAAALLRNGTGRLTTIDINPNSGYLISGAYAEVVDRLIGDSPKILESSSTPVDLFLHDSWHTFEHETAELTALRPRLMEHSMILSDNAHGSDALPAFAERTGRSFLYFNEEPESHWYPGDGIGAAYRQWNEARPSQPYQVVERDTDESQL